MTRRSSGWRMQKGASEPRRKYKNSKTEVDGILFDSKKEAQRYQDLKMLEMAGAIKNLHLQPKIKIEIGGIKLMFDSGRQVTYIGDFQYYDNDLGKFIVEDTKGYRTRDYKLKKAMVRAMGIEIVET